MKLCSRCYEHLEHGLSRLPELNKQCEELLVRYGRSDGIRVRGGFPSGMNLDVSIITARADMLAILASWSSLVVEGRRLTSPPQREVRELSGFLRRHLPWLAAHSAAGDAAAELTQMVARVEAAVRPDGAHRYELGPCAREGCQGKVHVTMPGHDSPRQTRVSCDFGHEWQPHEWLRLGQRLAQARPGVTAGGVRGRAR